MKTSISLARRHRNRVLAVAVVAVVAHPVVILAQERLGGEFQVNGYTTFSQSGPEVAMNASGDFVVVWTSSGQDGSLNGVFGQAFTRSGVALGGEFRANTHTASSQSGAAVVMEADGDFVVVWTSDGQDGSGSGVFGQRFFPQGLKLDLEFPVNTYTTFSQGGASMAMDDAGDFVVVWSSSGPDGSLYGVRGRRFTGSGGGAEFQVNTYTTNDQYGASVGIDADGDFVVVWEGAPNGMSGQRFASSGNPSGSEFAVSTYTSAVQRNPAVAMDATGDFVVVWTAGGGRDGSSYGLFGQRFASNGVRLGSEFQVNTYTTFAQSFHSVGMDAAGDFVVVWRSGGQDGNGDGIFGQRFTSNGAKLGGEFQVNTYTTGNQDGPAVAMDAAGNFVVVWRSEGQDGDGGGIFGQRFRFGELDFFIGDDEEEGPQRDEE